MKLEGILLGNTPGGNHPARPHGIVRDTNPPINSGLVKGTHYNLQKGVKTRSFLTLLKNRECRLIVPGIRTFCTFMYSSAHYCTFLNPLFLGKARKTAQNRLPGRATLVQASWRLVPHGSALFCIINNTQFCTFLTVLGRTYEHTRCRLRFCHFLGMLRMLRRLPLLRQPARTTFTRAGQPRSSDRGVHGLRGPWRAPCTQVPH